jgi:hypothetical protein
MWVICSAYGLTLRANHPLPGLLALPSATRIDVEIEFGQIPASLGPMISARPEEAFVSPYCEPHGEAVLRVWRLVGGDFYRFLYCNGHEFFINRRGTYIGARWPETSSLADASCYVLGPILAFVLRLRGVVCLHASAVAVDGRAIAFVGPVGAGKSTIAAAFANQGYPVIADDIVALDERSQQFFAIPAYPRLRLRPATVKHFYGAEDALPLLAPNNPKRAFDLLGKDHLFQPNPLPLGAIYILGAPTAIPMAPLVDSLRPVKALVSLVTNTFMNYLLNEEQRAQEFELLSRLLASVPLRSLITHSDPSRLSEQCNVTLSDFQALACRLSASECTRI